jgi:pyruvate ferredoxin oxidoreductase gamma subunit
MYQIRIHGRGGQGVVTAAELIAMAAFSAGHEAQAFPAFGVERTGAPIEAYARIDDKPIRTREQIYSPDVLIIQDASLIGAIDLTKGCNDKTVAIINTSLPKEELGLSLPADNIYTVDATEIALRLLGKNIVNTVILGTFAKHIDAVSLDSLKAAIKEKFGQKDKVIVEKNTQAITEAYAR